MDWGRVFLNSSRLRLSPLRDTRSLVKIAEIRIGTFGDYKVIRTYSHSMLKESVDLLLPGGCTR